MAISETQLNTWSNQGSIQMSAATHEGIRKALNNYNWPSWVRYEDYLSGSYRNNTNIYGDSDVDLVLEVTSFFHHSHLTEEQEKGLGLTGVEHSLDDFKSIVIKALKDIYGIASVDTSGRKAIKLLKAPGRLDTDILPCATYRNYRDGKLKASGITFWPTGGTQIINYPKVHYDNGTIKNQNTREYFKPVVRIFKNARNRLYLTNPGLAGRFPSYFVECLVYNIPDAKFGGTFQSTLAESLNWLSTNLNNEAPEKKFVCQNYQEWLFGDKTTQWNLRDAQELVRQLINLWNAS